MVESHGNELARPGLIGKGVAAKLALGAVISAIYSEWVIRTCPAFC
jgi:hypothetical protein